MTNDREIPKEHSDELEQRKKDVFIWALGESVITEMTRAVRDNDAKKMEINHLYSLFDYISHRNGINSIAELISPR